MWELRINIINIWKLWACCYDTFYQTCKSDVKITIGIVYDWDYLKPFSFWKKLVKWQEIFLTILGIRGLHFQVLIRSHQGVKDYIILLLESNRQVYPLMAPQQMIFLQYHSLSHRRIFMKTIFLHKTIYHFCQLISGPELLLDFFSEARNL